jgi:sodium/hydrogen antiporter
MFTTVLLAAGLLLLALAVGEARVRALPLTPAVIYLAAGALAGLGWGAPSLAEWARSPWLVIGCELAVLLSLFGVGLRLRELSGKSRLATLLAPLGGRTTDAVGQKAVNTWARWRAAFYLAGPGMLVAIGLGSVAAHVVLGLPWPVALLLASILAPTDPVLASDVQIRDASERDAVRLALTAEGGLNDGSAFPAVMLALGLLGLHDIDTASWWLRDLLWPIGGGALLGWLFGHLLGHALRWRSERGEPLLRGEMLYVGAVVMGWGLARLTATSTFVVVFCAAVAVLLPLSARGQADRRQALAERLDAFGASGERLAEAAAVVVIGAALSSVSFSLPVTVFALSMLMLVRPLSVLAVLRLGSMSRTQRRLVAWFGIRGIGSLFYLALALEHGLQREWATAVTSAALVVMALSIVLHGVSATPLMNAYQRRRERAAAAPSPASSSASSSAPERGDVR